MHDTEGKMPYRALKVDSKADAKGTIYKGDVTISNISSMNPDALFPKTIRLKARLDKDGQGGPDQPGDLVGKVNSLIVGDPKKILINTKL